MLSGKQLLHASDTPAPRRRLAVFKRSAAATRAPIGSDLSIVIRTTANDPQRWFVGAGGAVLVNSDPTEEYLEMVQKASPPLAATLLARQTVAPAAADGRA